MKNYLGLLAAIALPVLLNGCTPLALATGAGATVGVAAAQEGGVKGAATDASIRLTLTDLWLKKDPNLYRRLSMTVKEGRVLITGHVPDPDQRVDAVRLAWQADGVKQVINEIVVDEDVGAGDYVKDSWITSDIKARLMFDKYVQSINYSIETVAGVVYIMGVAQDQRELDRVLDYARNTKYVKSVTSYVRMRGETPPGIVNPETGEIESSIH
ncbi:MAG TPA: BON domain-containing protein [Patescibacteria group bacterium]|nr:BON domain-containing protein [Patescibacteria group bacterium]